jgi:cell division septation protein DedD
MARIFLILLTVATVLVLSCSEKKEKVEALQQEAQEPETESVLDSLEQAGQQPKATPDTVETMEKVTPPAEEQKPPERMPDYSQQSGYVVQIGSYAYRDFAEMVAEKYRKRDYPTFVTEATIGGETLYRVRIGVYDTFDEAKNIGDELKDRFSAQYWVAINP